MGAVRPLQWLAWKTIACGAMDQREDRKGRNTSNFREAVRKHNTLAHPLHSQNSARNGQVHAWQGLASECEESRPLSHLQGKFRRGSGIPSHTRSSIWAPGQARPGFGLEAEAGAEVGFEPKPGKILDASRLELKQASNLDLSVNETMEAGFID